MAIGYTSYMSAMLTAVRPVTTSSLQSDENGTRAWMYSVLTGEHSATPVAAARELPRDDAFIAKLFQGFVEISGTFDSLKSIPNLTRHAPPRRSGIAATDYLRMMVEIYLSEIYVLKERCDAYRTMVTRSYRKGKRAVQVKQMLDGVGLFTAESFTTMVSARGAHVHQARHDDPELRRLSVIALLATGEDKRFVRLRTTVLRNVRRQKVEWMAQNNVAIQKFLDLYFQALSRVVLASDSKVRLPKATAT